MLLVAAGLLATVPFSRSGAGVTRDCGSPFFAVHRADPGEQLEGLRRLGGGDGADPTPSADALARLAQLEVQLAWYGTCHRAAALRLTAASVLVGSASVAGLSLLRPSGRRRAHPVRPGSGGHEVIDLRAVGRAMSDHGPQVTP